MHLISVFFVCVLCGKQIRNFVRKRVNFKGISRTLVMDFRVRSRILLESFWESVQNEITGMALGFLFLFWIPHLVRSSLLLVVSVMFLAKIFAPLVMNWRPRRKITSKGKAVLITGCSSGFGYETAKVLDHLGFQIFAGCRSLDCKGANDLRKSCSSRLRIVKLDVTEEDSVKRAVGYVKEHLGENKLWAVINNAGIFHGGELHWINMDILKRLIDVNTLGVVRVTKAFLSLLINSRGRVITVGSAGGRNIYPVTSTYGISKSATAFFTEGLRMEMYKFGVKVIIVEPWIYKTPMADKQRVAECITNAWNESPEETRLFYAPGYIEKFKKRVINAVNYTGKNNLNEVVSCIEEAVTAENPRFSYGPGSLFFRGSIFILKIFPKPFADLLILKFFYWCGKM